MAQVTQQGSYKDGVKLFFQTEQANTEKVIKANLGLGEADDIPPYQYAEYPKHLYASSDPENFISVNSKQEEDAAIAAGAFPTYAAAKAAAAQADADQKAADEAAAAYIQKVGAEAQAIRTNKKG